jgi:branched-chain amino acid transport system ATP-binding protein
VTAESKDSAVFEARGVVAGYLPGVDILNGCDLELDRGEIVGVIGPNGAGKSTLLKAMFGIVPVRSGNVILRGEDITNLPAHDLVARGVGFVPQVANVFPTLTIEENLRIGAYRNPKDFDVRFAAITELFPRLAERRRQRAGSMSGGERQMLAFSRALMPQPDVLLLDEPSAGLSPIVQDRVFELVQQVHETGIAIVMVEQNARRCLELADRAYVLDQGTNAYAGTGEELLHDPKVVDLYLGTLARAR